MQGHEVFLLFSLIVTARALVDYERLNSVYRPATLALGLGALGALAVGWLRPAPWLLALLLLAILNVVWLVAVDRWLRVRDQMLADETASYGPDPGGTSARAGREGIWQRLRPFGAFCYPSGAFCY